MKYKSIKSKNYFSSVTQSPGLKASAIQQALSAVRSCVSSRAHTLIKFSVQITFYFNFSRILYFYTDFNEIFAIFTKIC